MDQLIQQAARLLRAAQQIVVMTGAGVSAESGVPTFREAQTGLWAQYDPQDLATPAAFTRNPRLVWEWYASRREIIGQSEPNAGHFALAQLEAQHGHVTVVTQNVDNLHERAGSQDVIHLHGNIMRTKCFYDCQGNPTLVDLSDPAINTDALPPLCPHCGRWLRPDVVWFGEILPARALERAMTLSEGCDVQLVVGTSGLVEPAAGLPRITKQHGGKVIVVNPDHTMHTRIADVSLRGASGEVLPQVLQAMASLA